MAHFAIGFDWTRSGHTNVSIGIIGYIYCLTIYVGERCKYENGASCLLVLNWNWVEWNSESKYYVFTSLIWGMVFEKCRPAIEFWYSQKV